MLAFIDFKITLLKYILCAVGWKLPLKCGVSVENAVSVKPKFSTGNNFCQCFSAS